MISRQAVLLSRPLGNGKRDLLNRWVEAALVGFEVTKVGGQVFYLVWKEDACEEPLWQSFLREVR